MSENKKPSQNDKVPNNVIALTGQCLYEDCKAKAKKANFCNEHFDWFKYGLITKKGERAKDFDKKLQSWEKKKAA